VRIVTIKEFAAEQWWRGLGFGRSVAELRSYWSWMLREYKPRSTASRACMVCGGLDCSHTEQWYRDRGADPRRYLALIYRSPSAAHRTNAA
jgi:hypothetical protein